MVEARILDGAIVKDLLNHIYEKRKATAFQIENLTKSALARDDSGLIYKLIHELTELVHSGSTLAKMGAITALGSVSVALGSLAIAYFLEEIVRPIFFTFKDTDARVRYYACESLYNIAKIARGEILLYLTEVFDILCILVTDTESSVKNAADILDRLIKDIVSAKSASYVSILHQRTDEVQEVQSNMMMLDGVSVQINNPQDPLKAFSLPRFMPTLLERMYTIEPFAKKFLLSWLELFDDIPSSELITFLPNFLEPLLRFLMNSSPSDVRIETQNLLNTFLKEIKALYKVKSDVKRRQILIERKKRLQNQPDSAEPPEENCLPKGLNEQLKRAFLSEQKQRSPDTISIESTSTTIIRRPNTPEYAEAFEPQAEEDDASSFVSGQDIFINYSQIIEILIKFLRQPTIKGVSDSRAVNFADESHDICLEIQSIALTWLQEIITISPTSFLKSLPDCVSIIMQNVAYTDSHNDTELRNQFLDFDKSLRRYLIQLHECHSDDPSDIWKVLDPSQIDEVSEAAIQGLNKDSYDEFLELYLMKTFQVVLNECLQSINELARLTSIDWLTFLYSNYRSSFFPHDEDGETTGPKKKLNLDLTALLKSSVNASNEVISKVLSLAAQISADNQDFFRDFMIKLISFFESDGPDSALSLSGAKGTGLLQFLLSRSKVEFVIRRLCVSISSEKIFKTFAEVLKSSESASVLFVSNMVVTLNNILLTTVELQGLRKKLKNLDICQLEDWNFFSTIFQTWCYNAPSVLSLCLLTSNYELAFSIIKDLAELEVSFQLLTQLDILIQLLESHIFLKLRLQLLEPEKYPYLYKTLYGILMILPQSSTYNVLRNRLSSLTLFTQSPNLHQPLGTPLGTPVVTTTTATLSTKKKRINEMAEVFLKINELHESGPVLEKQKDLVEAARVPSATKYPFSTSFPSSESKAFIPDYFYQALPDGIRGKR